LQLPKLLAIIQRMSSNPVVGAMAAIQAGCRRVSSDETALSRVSVEIAQTSLAAIDRWLGMDAVDEQLAMLDGFLGSLHPLVAATVPDAALGGLSFDFVPSIARAADAKSNDELKAYLIVNGPAIVNSLTNARPLLERHVSALLQSPRSDSGANAKPGAAHP
jgi:hypothetical protein